MPNVVGWIVFQHWNSHQVYHFFYIINFPFSISFPSIIALARKYNLPIIADEIYGGCVFAENVRHVTPLLWLSQKFSTFLEFSVIVLQFFIFILFFCVPHLFHSCTLYLFCSVLFYSVLFYSVLLFSGIISSDRSDITYISRTQYHLFHASDTQ